MTDSNATSTGTTGGVVTMTTTSPPTPPSTPAETATDSDGEKDWKAEYEKTLAESRKWEGRAKASAPAAKELEKLKQESMTELDRAVAVAREEAKLEGLREGSSRIVHAEIRAAAAGRPVDVDALLEGVDAARFIDEHGEVDRAAIAAWVDRVAPTPTAPEIPSFADLGQGTRGQAISPGDDDALKNMILKAVGGPRK